MSRRFAVWLFFWMGISLFSFIVYQRYCISKLIGSGIKWGKVGECVNSYVYINICIDRL